MAATTESTPLNAAPAASRPVNLRLVHRVLGLAGITVLVAATVALVRHTAAPGTHVRSVSQSDLSMDFPGASDRVVSLSSIPSTYTSRLFAGYLPIANGGEGFYFFAESQSETPDKDPVLLWLNGGPGASSLGGCFSENGPLLVNKDGKTLRENEFAWNKNTNMVCIESPVGVGFSYNASAIYKSGDAAQAEDLYWMLQVFFDKFPWLRANDFVITGESYGGVYVPMTAKRIVEGNQRKDAPVINLKKFVVGNGVNEFTSLSKVAFAYFHGLISTDDYSKVTSVCPELLTPSSIVPSNISDACGEAVEASLEAIQNARINIYNIYETCFGDTYAGLQELIDELQGPALATPHPVGLTLSLYLDMTELQTFFNLPDVRTSFHTKKEVARWTDVVLTSANLDIGSLLNQTGDELAATIKNKVLEFDPSQQTVVTPIWKFLIDNGVEGVIYHGDVDMACDFIGGLWAVESLGLPRKQSRTSWTIPGDDQIAGFYEDFGVITYVTVKGSGHMVPTDKPAEAKAMLDQFVLN